MKTIKLELTPAELDVICLALHDANEYRLNQEINLKSNAEAANVYNYLRKAIRAIHPHNSSMNQLIKTIGNKR
jgi:hypothetical protein